VQIESVKAVYPKYENVVSSWRTHLWQIIVEIRTDCGIAGYGYGGGGLASLPIVNGHFNELLVGEDLSSPEDVSRIWDRLYYESIPYGRKGIAMMALSGVDLALWDTLGKAEIKPVAELIGGVRKQRINVYATGMDSKWYAELGVSGQKLTHRWNGIGEDAVASAKAAREAMGDDVKIMFDVYMSWNADVALQMATALADLDIYWFEDVLTPDDLSELGELRVKLSPINLAGGEHEFGVAGFNEIAQYRAYDVWQPDITWCGGITAGLRICELAEQHGIPVAPHRGGEVWGLHLIAANDACDNLAEMVLGGRDAPTDNLWAGAPMIEDGKLSINDVPGFGVRLNEAML
jgi:L-alanine-DL-glutamate epimerase-like enolase superfamily enzyme